MVVSMKAGHDIFERRKLLEQPNFLERARDAMARALIGPQLRNVAPAKHDRAGIGLVDAAQKVEQRRLAGAIGADDGEYGSGFDGERDIANRVHAAEALAQTLGAQERACGQRTRFGCGGNRGSHVAIPCRTTGFRGANASRTASTMPPGMNRTTSVIATP